MKWFLASFLLFSAAAGLSRHWTSEAASSRQIEQEFGIAAPLSADQCPTSHPIKGNFTASSGDRCIFHSPGGEFYEKTKPEKCYGSATDSIADGCRPSRR
jgi:hypothetical protein